MVPTSAGLSGGSFRISSIATQLPDFMSPMHLAVILQISTRLIGGVMVWRSAQNANDLAVPIDRQKLYRMKTAGSAGQEQDVRRRFQVPIEVLGEARAWDTSGMTTTVQCDPGESQRRRM